MMNCFRWTVAFLECYLRQWHTSLWICCAVRSTSAVFDCYHPCTNFSTWPGLIIIDEGTSLLHRYWDIMWAGQLFVSLELPNQQWWLAAGISVWPRNFFRPLTFSARAYPNSSAVESNSFVGCSCFSFSYRENPTVLEPSYCFHLATLYVE